MKNALLNPRTSRTYFLTTSAGLALALCMTPLAGFAETWDGPAADPDLIEGGPGTWDTSTVNWLPDGATINLAWPDGSTANFSTGSGAVTLPETVGIGGLNFSSTGYNLTGPGALELQSNTTVTVSAGASASISTDITEAAPFQLTIAGPGSLAFSGDASHTGGTTVTGGTFVLTGSLASGLSNTATVNALGAVSGDILNEGSATLNVTGNLTADNGLTNKDSGQLHVTGGNFTGIKTLNNSATITIDQNRTLSSSGITNQSGAQINLQGTLANDTDGTSNAGTIDTAGGSSVLSGDVSNTGMIEGGGCYGQQRHAQQ